MAKATLTAESADHNTANIFSTFDRATIASAVEVLIGVLDAMDPDSDLEEDDPSEDNCDQEAIDEREPDYDAEVEFWAHWMDHPAGLHIGERPGHTSEGCAKTQPTTLYGVDQSRAIGPDNPPDIKIFRRPVDTATA